MDNESKKPCAPVEEEGRDYDALGLFRREGDNETLMAAMGLWEFLPAWMEDAYKARYFDDIMARKTAETAKKTESGVVERIRQRGARPSENGTNPGGAAVLKTDVSKLTPAQCEELERRAMRGQIITF